MERNSSMRPCCRPYQRTCGMMNQTPMPIHSDDFKNNFCSNTPAFKKSCPIPESSENICEMFQHLQHLPVTMAYVPDQQMASVYEPGYALQAGTIFPQLCKPFCGKRGSCR